MVLSVYTGYITKLTWQLTENFMSIVLRRY